MPARERSHPARIWRSRGIQARGRQARRRTTPATRSACTARSCSPTFSSRAGASLISRRTSSSSSRTARSHTMPRSCASEPLAIAQPSLRRPTRFAEGTTTSSKNTSLRSARSGCTISAKGRTVIPDVAMSTSRTLMPWCLGAAGSVRQKRKQKSACAAPEVHTFWPFTTKRLPSSTALRAERRQVASRAGLAHAEAGAAFATEDRHRVVADLLVVAVVEEGRDDDAEALRVRGARNSCAHQLLEVHERLDRSRVASTAVRRPSGYEPTGIEHATRPRACPTGEVRRSERRLGRDLVDGRRAVARASA